MSIKREQEPVVSTPSNKEKQRLYVQYAVSRVLLEATNRDDAAQGLLQAIGEGIQQEASDFSWEAGAFWIIDEQSTVLRCLATWHSSTSAALEFEAMTRQVTFLPGVGLPGRVWTSGEPAWVSDIRTDGNFTASSENLNAAFAFPICSASGILGVIEFFSRQISPPDEGLIRVVLTIGNQVGQFLEKKHAEEALRTSRERSHALQAEAEAATRRLESVLAVTDTALTHLDLNNLLRELLTRIHEIMAVDNVVILLTTEDHQYLTLRAAFGPEEEVADQVRVPIGRGFAGIIAATAQPRIIEDLSTAEVMTPLLREKLTSLLGVPLLAPIVGVDEAKPAERLSTLRPSQDRPSLPDPTRVIGVIHIGTMSSRRFTEDDVELLQRVADRVSLAITQSRLYEAEQLARNEAISLERHTRNSLNALLAMAEALVLVDDADITQSAGNATSSEVTALARRLAELIRNVLACKRVAITALDPETREPRAIAAVGISSEQEQKWRSREPGSVLAHMFTDPDSIMRLYAGEVLTIDMSQPPFHNDPNPYRISTMLLAPMSIGDTLVGILAVDDGGSEHTYTPEEISMTSAVAKLAALVIERARLLREREEARANELALRNANRRMDEFLGIASHELRTPLTTIKANIQMAERQLNTIDVSIERSKSPINSSRASSTDRPLSSSDASQLSARLAVVQELLARADQQASVLNRLIGDLLNVSRIQTNKLELLLQPTLCNLLTIVQQSVQEQRKVVPKRTIRLRLPPQQNVPVIADADRIEQVVINFLTNALKYSSTDQPVTVSLDIVEAELFARVSISDNGPGLTPAQQEHIWERFYRVPGIEVKSGSGIGLGLGLYISKIIIERHSGHLGLSSTPGKGSTFWFTIPLAPTPPLKSNKNRERKTQ